MKGKAETFELEIIKCIYVYSEEILSAPLFIFVNANGSHTGK